MLVGNPLNTEVGHESVIRKQMMLSDEVDLAVAYVSMGGVTVFAQEIKKLNKKLRLIFYFDMEVNDPSAVKALLSEGVDVRAFVISHGKFHPKLWIFRKGKNQRNCLIGSANFTKSAMHNNVELGVLLSSGAHEQVVGDAVATFDALWNDENCRRVTAGDVEMWIKKKATSQKLEAVVQKAQVKYEFSSAESEVMRIDALKEFVKGWIGIGVGKTVAGTGTGSGKIRLWRGWYIIPDQGLIDDLVMLRLKRICAVIKSAGGSIGISKYAVEETGFAAVLEIFSEKLEDRKKHKMEVRELFVRQDKNYMLCFGLAFHPLKENGKRDKKILALSESGLKFAMAKSTKLQKKIYTENMDMYVHNGLDILRFTRDLLAEVDGYIDFIEFNFFVRHADSMQQVTHISFLIKTYRQMSDEVRNAFVQEINAYFKGKLEHTAKAVRSNYDKNTRHIMSALGWCEGLVFDEASSQLKILS